MSASAPALLYKYRDDSSRTEEIITTGCVWLSTASQLNDPLECKTGQVPDAWKQETIRQMEDAQISGFVLSAVKSFREKRPFYSLSSRAAKQWFKGIKRLKTRREKYERVRSFLSDHGREISRPEKLFARFDDQLAKVGVFSLSESPDNGLMWAHYGAGHSGLAFGFEREPGTKLASDEHTMQVMYDDCKPTIEKGFRNQIDFFEDPDGVFRSEQRMSFSDPTFRAAFSTKPQIWSYEKEWRYVEETSGLFPWPGPIDTIVFGLKMPVIRRLHYANLISSRLPKSVSFCEIAVTPDNASLHVRPWDRTT